MYSGADLEVNAKGKCLNMEKYLSVQEQILPSMHYNMCAFEDSNFYNYHTNSSAFGGTNCIVLPQAAWAW